MKILAHFKSRCRIFLECKDFNPLVIFINALQISPSSILERDLDLVWTIFKRSPPLAYSMMMQRKLESESKKASLNFTIYSSFNEARILI